MKFETAKPLILSGTPHARASWDDCRIVRAAVESDEEFINYPSTGLIVDDCDKRTCDCAIVIFHPTKKDIEADDWVVAEHKK